MSLYTVNIFHFEVIREKLCQSTDWLWSYSVMYFISERQVLIRIFWCEKWLSFEASLIQIRSSQKSKSVRVIFVSLTLTSRLVSMIRPPEWTDTLICFYRTSLNFGEWSKFLLHRVLLGQDVVHSVKNLHSTLSRCVCLFMDFERRRDHTKYVLPVLIKLWDDVCRDSYVIVTSFSILSNLWSSVILKRVVFLSQR